MIEIYRGEGKDCVINEFAGRNAVDEAEVVIKTKIVFGEEYTYVEPSKPGVWAFGGNILFTCNGIHTKFLMPLKLHDRNMRLEDRG